VVTVLEGRGEFYLDGERIDIKAGDQIIIPPNTPHAVITRSKKPLKVISIQSPEFLGKDRFFLED
jgi:mannose-6-phosphate isomerase-like protein (cupin superfamily)